MLRFAFLIAETGFDPAQVSDVYSRSISAAIFEAPMEFEFLARPYRLRPKTLAAMPEVSEDFKTFTFRVKPGIFFADDPAFGGRRRELVAADYVYAIKRHYDPRWKSNNLFQLENAKLLGLTELRREGMAKKQAFDYAREVEGIRVLDRYTYRIQLGAPEPRFLAIMTDVAWAAVAREVVEFYGERIMEHPVGTGPFRLGEWRRASRVVLERNPGFREVLYDEEAPAGDAMAQAAATALRGRRLPLVDRVEIAIIEEAQPRWLAFLNGEHDYIDGVPAEFADLVMPNNQARAQPAEARHQDAALSACRRGDLVLQHRRPDGRRLHAGQGRAAPRDQPRGGPRQGDPPGAQEARRFPRSRRSARKPGATTRRFAAR